MSALRTKLPFADTVFVRVEIALTAPVFCCDAAHIANAVIQLPHAYRRLTVPYMLAGAGEGNGRLILPAAEIHYA